METKYKFGSRSKEEMAGVWPYLVECANRSLSKSKHDMCIPWAGGVRTPEKQNGIFKNGHSKCDGYKILSYHQAEASETGYGMALDIIPYIKGKPVIEGYKHRKIQNYFARLFFMEWQEMIFEYAQKGIDIGALVWGGTFGESGWDPWHFEVRI